MEIDVRSLFTPLLRQKSLWKTTQINVARKYATSLSFNERLPILENFLLILVFTERYFSIKTMEKQNTQFFFSNRSTALGCIGLGEGDAYWFSWSFLLFHTAWAISEYKLFFGQYFSIIWQEKLLFRAFFTQCQSLRSN